MWKKFIQDYLTFTKKDRIGVLTLLTIIFIILIIPRIFPSLVKQRPLHTNDEIEKFAQSLDKATSAPKDTNNNAVFKARDVHPETEYRLFYFDPNTATIEQWIALGVREKTAQTIRKYLSKGGRFKKPEDLKKIYTLPADVADRLMPYIRIPSEEKEIHNTPPIAAAAPKINNVPPHNDNPPPNRPAVSGSSYARKEYRNVDINLADTTAFQTFPGIASKMSARIINYREKLGGFVSINQVAEVWPLPDSVFQKIKPYLQLSPYTVRKMNLNTITIDELRAHPYLGYTIANTIIQYRNQHGNFKSIQDLRKIHSIDENLYKKIFPYLSVE